MKVILLKPVPKVGKPGDVLEVSDGYALNSLFPSKSAIAATAKNLEVLNRKKQSDVESKALQHGLLKNAIEKLPNTTLEIAVKANEKGHLFSKVDESTIVEALLKHRISISPKNIILPELIKQLGIYKVGVKEGEYSAEINVSIIQG